MATTGKSIKELINSRISGTIYRRQPQAESTNSRPTLQDIAESVLLESEREEEVEQLFMHKSQKIQELNNAIVHNSVENSSPLLNRIHTPTILQKLNPTQHSRKKAYVAVAEAQATIAKESVGMLEMKKVQVKQATVSSGFSRVPKFLENY